MVETRGGRRFALFFLVASFLVLLLGHWLRPIGDTALTVTAPFQWAISTVSSNVGDAVSGVVEGPRLRAENIRVKNEMARLLNQNILLQQQLHDYQLFKRMLRYQELNPSLDLLTARLIANDPNNASYILINKGTRDRLKDGMTVLDQNGYFVGKITAVVSNASKVLLMTSPSNDVGAIDLKTRAAGVVEGVYGGRPQFQGVVSRVPVRVRDFVITSGAYNLFPRGLLLGQVARVRHADFRLFQSVEIQPAADFGNLELLRVVRNFSPSKPTKLISGP